MPAYIISPLKSALIGLMFITACAASCKRDTSKAKDNDPGSVSEVKAQFDILSDSVRVSWAQLDNLTEHKLKATDELLAELRSTNAGTANPARLATFSQRIATARSLRLKQETLSDNQRLDSFDAAQDSLFTPLARLAAPGDQAPNEKIRDLVEVMRSDDASEVSQRIRYDRFVKSYNDYLKLHGEKLQQLGGKYSALKPLPMFTIQL